MNTVLLEYAVEVEKWGSITQAAASLYMDQPNLSKAIKTLEESLGAPIFDRTPKGVLPTERGRIFLEYARNVLAQIEEMENLYQSNNGTGMELSLSVPRAGYISYGFTRFVKQMDRQEMVSLWLRENNTSHTLHGVERGEYNLGIIRYLTSAEKHYTQMIVSAGLDSMTLSEFKNRVVLSANHPLAACETLTLDSLHPYIEITYGESITGRRDPVRTEEGEKNSRSIYVFERESQFRLLRENPDTYMCGSPLPETVLTENGLVQKSCTDEMKTYKDVLVYRKGYDFSTWDHLFLKELEKVKKEIFK